MHSISAPEETYEDVFNRCLSDEPEEKRSEFIRCLPELLELMGEYDVKMENHSAHELVQFSAELKISLSRTKLKWLYKSKLVPSKAPGRDFYNKFLVRSKRDGCSFCSYGDPTELDHFMPQGKYAQFAINPKNLVPCCSRCNGLKFTHHPSTSIECFVHPFFENYDDIRWLHVDMVYEQDTPTAKFFIESGELKQDVIERLYGQFNQMDLFERYSVQASRELSGRCDKLARTFRLGGENGLQDELEFEAASWERISKNSWQSAFYRGLAGNSRFLRMDWKL